MILFPFLFTLFLRKIKAKTKTNQIGCDAILFPCLTRVAALQGLSTILLTKIKSKRESNKSFLAA